MLETLYALPILVVLVLAGTGRVGSINSGLCGAAAAIAICITSAPNPLSITGLGLAVAKGLWLCWLVGIVILSGLFFRHITFVPAQGVKTTQKTRRRLFSACFLIGPFAEASTGFGIGQIATIAALKGINLKPVDVVLLAMFGQSLVPWGAMGNSTMVGAELAGLPPNLLGFYSAVVSIPLVFSWLIIYWKILSNATLLGDASENFLDLGWMACILAFLGLANYILGPEIAAMAALGPLIVMQFWLDGKPSVEAWKLAARIALPYGLLILVLVICRAVPALQETLKTTVHIQPFPNSTPWFPLMHPATWLIAIGIVMSRDKRYVSAIYASATYAWLNGRKAVLTVGIYFIIARIMSESGMASALASTLQTVFGRFSILSAPLVAGLFGFLTGSSSAANSLLMIPQRELAIHTGAPMLWLAAIQNTTAAALTMLSPARVAMACALVNKGDLERSVYKHAWPIGASSILIMTATTAVILLLK